MTIGEGARPAGPGDREAQLAPPLALLRAFVAVGRVGGIRKAARVLGVDHTVVSRHLRNLEEMLATPLFLRSRGGLVLTEAGANYHRRVAAALAEIVAATGELTGKGQDIIRLWAVPGFAIQWLSPRIAEFERAHPDVTVELRPTDSRADLASLEADIDIRFYGDDWPPEPAAAGLRQVELARPRLMIVASPPVAARMAGCTAADLVTAPLIHEEHQEQWRAWLSRNGIEVPARLPGALMWHAHHALAAAREGRGIALASRYLVEKDLDRRELVELDVSGTSPVEVGAYVLVGRPDRWALPSIQALRRFLIARARDMAD